MYARVAAPGFEIDEERPYEGTRGSVVVFFCGSPLLVLLVSSLLPTEASRAYPQLWMGTHPTLPSRLLQAAGRPSQEEPRVAG